MRAGRRAVLAGGAVAAAGGAWSLFESQWIEFVELDVAIAGLPPELEGFRILHLSDFHLGTVSFNGRNLDRAVEWAGEREFDLVAITGDLLSRRRGENALRNAVARLRARHGTYAILGNHDIAETRDPFAEASDLADLPGAVLLAHADASFDARGVRVQVTGVDPHAFIDRRARPAELADSEAGLRILLCHFPDVVDRLPAGAFDLILAGHLHGGQICIPSPWGKLHLEHLRAPYREGLYRTSAGTLYVSRGLGTSFVPFRLLARPEVTALKLKAAD